MPAREIMEPAMQDADQTPFRAIDDIGLRLPVGMTLPVDAELEAMVKRLAGVTRGAGIVIAAREIAADPSSTLRTVLALLKLLVFGRAQQTIDEVESGAARLGCKSGCAWCCHQSVEATIPEAILVAGHLADPSDPRRRRILENADRFRGLDERERRRTGSPCALLAEDNRCSVHDDRPLKCRAMMASDAESCHQAHLAALQGADAPVKLFLNAQYVILGDQAGLRGILRDMGLQEDVVELTQAVAAILRDPALVDRWLKRKRVFGAELAPPRHGEAEAVPAQ